ncbi:MAG: hypothetical protein JXQ29_08705 [Planctomycetes bacterium]|nr:hypothetical protein [Planctomycetota bacterium]
MTLYGNGRAVLANDADTASRLGWPRRRPSLPEPQRILHRRAGDPRREPWIAPPAWSPAPGPAALWRRPARARMWTYLAEPPGIERYLRRLAEAPSPPAVARVAIAGLGRVGGMAAAVLAATPCRSSGITELLISDRNSANLERWRLELEAIGHWRRHVALPRVQACAPEELFRRCDVFLFAATHGVPPIGSNDDVRMVQFAPNRAILATYLALAREAGFAGLFLIVSDPVEWLAQAAFRDSNVGAGGRFTGAGLAPERLGGLALGVMWARALARARAESWEESVRRHGAAFGPHSSEVLVFDDLSHPDPARSNALAESASRGNFLVRAAGFLPWVAPATSSVGLTLPRLLTGGEALASVFLDGLYFGAPARLDWALRPAPRTICPEIRAQLAALHARLAARLPELGLAFA